MACVSIRPYTAVSVRHILSEAHLLCLPVFQIVKWIASSGIKDLIVHYRAPQVVTIISNIR